MLAYADAEERLWLACAAPAETLARFDVPADQPVIGRFAGVLDTLPRETSPSTPCGGRLAAPGRPA